jgi:sugar lactone lactonase YvrE
VDSQGHVHIHHTVHATSQSADTVVVFDSKGKFVRSWGPHFKRGAHGLHISREGREEFLYLCDRWHNIVVKTTLKGEIVYVLGYPSESPAYQPGEGGQLPTYHPTNVAIAPNGDLYVADGYGSSYVMQYNSKGLYLRTFGGGRTKAAGDLRSPHGIVMDRRGPQPLLLVADRSNNRLQYFTLDGKHHSFVEGVKMPCHFDQFKNGDLLVPDLAARVTILDRNNEVVAHLGDDSESNWRETRTKPRTAFTPGKFVAPHGACYDSEGNIFVVEWVEVGRVTKLRKVA